MFQQPGMIEALNRETCPVTVLYTRDGFPTHLPAFKICENPLPWFRINSAFGVLMDGEGQHLVGGIWESIPDRFRGRGAIDSYFPLDRLEDGIRRYHRLQAIRRGDPSDPAVQAEAAGFRREIEAWTREAALPFLEPRLWTAMYVADYVDTGHWANFQYKLRYPEDGIDPLAPGVRNAALHALGDLVVNDLPLSPLASMCVRAQHREWTEKQPSFRAPPPVGSAWRARDAWPVPFDMTWRAATTLASTAGIQLPDDPDAAVAAARKWWQEHRTDERYRVRFSDEPNLRFAFSLSPPIATASAADRP